MFNTEFIIFCIQKHLLAPIIKLSTFTPGHLQHNHHKKKEKPSLFTKKSSFVVQNSLILIQTVTARELHQLCSRPVKSSFFSRRAIVVSKRNPCHLLTSGAPIRPHPCHACNAAPWLHQRSFHAAQRRCARWPCRSPRRWCVSSGRCRSPSRRGGRARRREARSWACISLLIRKANICSIGNHHLFNRKATFVQ